MQQLPYEFTKLIRCWRSMPQGKFQLPEKTTFSPVAIFNLMPLLFLLEREKHGEFAVRLTGSELEEQIKRLAGGSQLFDVLVCEDFGFYNSFFESCTQSVCGGRIIRRVHYADGLSNEIESLHLPLADSDGKGRFMLGVMTSKMVFYVGEHKQTRAHRPKGFDYQYIDLDYGVPDGAGETVFRHELALVSQQKAIAQIKGGEPSGRGGQVAACMG